jgi:phosphopantetheine--protein transferase-like protein
VDLVEFKKARAFYQAHKDFLVKSSSAKSGYFKKSEISKIMSSKRPHECLAVLFAAKEAVLKWLGAPSLGLQAFQEIEILWRKENEIFFRLKGALKKICSFTKPRPLFLIRRERFVVVVACAGI